MGARQALPRDEFADVNRGGIQSIRTSQYSADVVRVVLVLKQKIGYTVARDPRGAAPQPGQSRGSLPGVELGHGRDAAGTAGTAGTGRCAHEGDAAGR